MPDQKLSSKVAKWIEKFLDDELKHEPMSLQRPNQPSLIKQLNSAQFTTQFVENKEKKHCILEIIKPHCGACAYATKVTDAIGYKMEKHGYEVPIFRMMIENSLPYVGQLPFSPMYLLVKKNEDNQISEIQCLNGPLRGGNDFLKEMEESGMDLAGFTERVKIDN